MSPNRPRPAVHVVAGVVIDAAERVLIAQRPEGTHLAGGWEFPGGKLEPGEERLAGLARELREELGISIIGIPRPLIRVRHAYPSGEVLLDIWVVKRYSGEPRGLDGQALRWCTQGELTTANLLPADAPIVAALRLPDRLTEMSSPYYGVSDAHRLQRPILRATVARGIPLRGALCASAEEGVAAARAGADFLVMRGRLADAELAGLCGSVPVPVYAAQITMESAWALGASGVNEVSVSSISMAGDAVRDDR